MKRIQDGEILVLKTDKSGKLTLISREKYLELGKKENKVDQKIDRAEVKRIERKLNEHTKMWAKIVNAGEAHGHYSRIVSSKTSESEIVANKYFMYKDHKEKESYRPVVSGCTSNILGLSGLLSDIVESLCMSVKDPFEIISSEDLLARISIFNREIQKKREEKTDYDWREDYILIGTDVVSLFPSLSPEKTGLSVRLQA